MHIALVTREYPPETAWGGIGSFYHSLALSLSEAGHNVEVFCQALDEDRHTIQEGVIVHRILAQKDGWGDKTPGAMAETEDIGLFAVGLANAMHMAVVDRHCAEPFDLIEGHEHLGINSLINQSPLLNVPTVTRYHTAYETLVKRELVDWPESTLIKNLEEISINKANYRISTSDFISKVTLQDFDCLDEDTVIDNFVKRANFDGDWKDKENLILFVGRLVLGHKRPDIAVMAFEKFLQTHPEYHMEIIGPDMEHKEKKTVWNYCKSVISRKTLKSIDYIGAIPLSEVYDKMAKAKMIIVPSSFESFGMVAVEAMQHQCIPIVSRQTATAEVVSDKKLICDNDDIEAFASAMRTVAENEEASEKLSLSLRKRAINRFSDSSILAENLRFYSEALHKSLNNPPAPFVVGPLEERDAEQMPWVSVVVPNFNGEEFLPETLNSLVSQDYPKLEIIFVDGSSKDRSVDIARRYGNVTVISEPDKGQAHAINKGLLACKGDIVTYLNSDDIYLPGTVRAVVNYFNEHPEHAVLVGECDYINEGGDRIGHLKPVYSGIEGIIRFWGWEKWHCIPQQSTFWRRQVLETVGLFDAKRQFVMDLDYWIRIAMQYDFHLVNRTLAGFRLVTGTKTVSSTDRMYDEELQTFVRYKHLLPRRRRWASSVAARRHFSSKMIDTAGHLYLEMHQRRKALSVAAQSIKAFPPRLLSIRTVLLLFSVLFSAVGMRIVAERVHKWLLIARWKLRNSEG